MSAGRAVFVHGDSLDHMPYPPACPFNTSRAGRTRQIIDSTGLLEGMDRSVLAPAPAERRDLERFHSARYLDALRDAAAGRVDDEGIEMGFGSPDCPIFGYMHDYPVLATGATLAGAQAILSGDARVAFNPSGGFHHAGPDRASGFCYINDVVVACMVLAETGRRVAFVDLDVHHCDGVQAAFYRRRDVLTLSLHESGATLFPGTGFEEEIGEGPGRGYAVNVPLPVGTDDQAYLRAFREIGLPVLHACEPDVIVLELGMDGLMGDPLAHLHLTNNAYADAVGWVLHLGKPVLAVGGGGYNVENTARGWALMWSVLCGDSSADMAIGLGGVLLESAEWGGGLRDRVLASHGGQRDAVDRAIEATIRKLKSILFPIHRL